MVRHTERSPMSKEEGYKILVSPVIFWPRRSDCDGELPAKLSPLRRNPKLGIRGVPATNEKRTLLTTRISVCHSLWVSEE